MDTPPVLTREELVLAISDAFKGVNRGAGISWSKSYEIDALYGNFRLHNSRVPKDNDRHWTDLVEDETWRPDCGVGGWGFLDPISFRYYIPAGMMRCINSGQDEGIMHHLTLDPPPEQQRGWLRRALRWPNFREHTLKRWSGLTLAQRRSVRDFIRYMVVNDENEEVWAKFRWGGTWAKALASYWDSVI